MKEKKLKESGKLKKLKSHVIKMTLKQFLKPDWRKIVIFVVLIIIFSLIIWFFPTYNIFASCFPCGDCGINRGFPLTFHVSHPAGKCETEFYTSYLIIDIIVDVMITYFLSCLIVWIYDKVKKK
jgi:hypothetical protein